VRVALISLIFGVMTACSQTERGLFVRVAGLGRCSDIRDIILHVRSHGLMLNQEQQKPETLGARLDVICATRWSKHVYVTSDPEVRFGDVLRVIRIAAAHVDYVVIVTPSVLKQATYRSDGRCLAPYGPVRGEFIKSRSNRCLVQSATVPLPAIRGKTYRRPWPARIRQAAF
jgi:hypothetical protein